MGQLVSEDVKQHWPWQTDKRDQPEHRAQREEPEFLSGPQTLRDRRSREHGEKCLSQNRADREQKDGEDKFHPARRDHERSHRGRAPSCWDDVGWNFYSAT